MKLFVFSVLILFLFAEMKYEDVTDGNYAYDLASIVAGVHGYPENTDDTTITPFFYYNGTLIELVLKDVTETTVTPLAVTVEKHFNTMAVQLIDPVTKQFVQFDSFYSGAKVIAHGIYKDSPIGVKLGDFSVDESSITDGKNLPGFRDTVMHGQDLKYDASYYKNRQGKDSAIFIMYFHKTNKLFTPFMIGGLRFTRTNIALSGFEYIVFRAGKKIKKLTENIRPLSDYESSVCEQIYRKSLFFTK